MNILDTFILIPILYGAYKGFTKGLIIEVASLVALLLGIYAALKFSQLIEIILVSKLHITSEYVGIIAFAITFIGVIFAIYILARFINRILKAISLDFVNKLLGACFGAVKFLLIISIIISVFVKINNNVSIVNHTTIDESLLLKPTMRLSQKIYPLLMFNKNDNKNDKP